MIRFAAIHLSFLVLALSPLQAASVLVNEYNGVADDDQLDGGDGSDSFFGTVQGNGGDWFELVVVGGGGSGSTVDMRGWTIEIEENGPPAKRVVLSNAAYWSDVQAGTILTFIETEDAGGKDTGTQILAEDRFLSEGWAWTNIFIGDATYVDTTASDADLDISNDDVTITVKDDGGTVVFGPVGEGAPTHPGSGVNSEEAFVFKGDPLTGVTPSNGGFDDGDNSTFGAPNTWDDGGSVQSFIPFRTITDAPAFTTVPPGDPVVAGNAFTYDLEAADANGGTFTITAPTLPSWLSLTDNGDGTAELSGTPDNADAGVHAVELEVRIHNFTSFANRARDVIRARALGRALAR